MKKIGKWVYKILSPKDDLYVEVKAKLKRLKWDLEFKYCNKNVTLDDMLQYQQRFQDIENKYKRLPKHFQDRLQPKFQEFKSRWQRIFNAPIEDVQFRSLSNRNREGQCTTTSAGAWAKSSQHSLYDEPRPGSSQMEVELESIPLQNTTKFRTSVTFENENKRVRGRGNIAGVHSSGSLGREMVKGVQQRMPSEEREVQEKNIKSFEDGQRGASLRGDSASKRITRSVKSNLREETTQKSLQGTAEIDRNISNKVPENAVSHCRSIPFRGPKYDQKLNDGLMQGVYRNKEDHEKMIKKDLEESRGGKYQQQIVEKKFTKSTEKDNHIIDMMEVDSTKNYNNLGGLYQQNYPISFEEFREKQEAELKYYEKIHQEKQSDARNYFKNESYHEREMLSPEMQTLKINSKVSDLQQHRQRLEHCERKIDEKINNRYKKNYPQENTSSTFESETLNHPQFRKETGRNPMQYQATIYQKKTPEVTHSFTKKPERTSKMHVPVRVPSPPIEEAKEVVEEEPLEILDMNQYFTNDYDLSTLDNSVDTITQIETVEQWARNFEDRVNTFSKEKYSLEYLVLNEKLMRLIEHLDKLKSPPDGAVTRRKITVIHYIQNLFKTLDANAPD